MIDLTTQQFKSKIHDFEQEEKWQYKGQKPMVIDFYADWCNPCKIISTMLKNFKKEYKNIDFYQINSEEEYELTEYFKLRNLPTIAFISSDGKFKLISGSINRHKLEEEIKNINN
jgi:thioredoxin 1